MTAKQLTDCGGQNLFAAIDALADFRNAPTTANANRLLTHTRGAAAAVESLMHLMTGNKPPVCDRTPIEKLVTASGNFFSSWIS